MNNEELIKKIVELEERIDELENIVATQSELEEVDRKAEWCGDEIVKLWGNLKR